jgi:hypothetical protein
LVILSGFAWGFPLKILEAGNSKEAHFSVQFDDAAGSKNEPRAEDNGIHHAEHSHPLFTHRHSDYFSSRALDHCRCEYATSNHSAFERTPDKLQPGMEVPQFRGRGS